MRTPRHHETNDLSAEVVVERWHRALAMLADNNNVGAMGSGPFMPVVAMPFAVTTALVGCIRFSA